MRTVVKHAAERILLRGGLASLARVLIRNRSLILAYHNIVPSGSAAFGDQSLHLSESNFARQLDVLTDTHDVVSLPSVLEGRNGTGRGRVAITFDDAYQGATTVGVRELAARGLPATVFVAPAFVGGGAFWWDALADPATGAVRDSLREQALADHRGEDHRVRAWAEAQSVPLRAPPAYATVASEEELHHAASTPGITLASHTWSHPNLTRLSTGEIMTELRRPLTWLEERFPDVIRWLTYPYGLCSSAVEDAAATVGYEAALLVEGGWVPRTLRSRHRVPRLNVPAGMSADGFALRLAGVMAR